MMTLFNKKKPNQNDRITDLPINVIDGILANLKVRDLVRTSILSKKWRYMWTSAPHLCFDDDFYQRFQDLDDPYPVMYKTITDVLMFHNGPIHNFSVCIYDDFDFKINTENINMWIPFMSRDIKHLELVTHCTVKDQMPDILLSCKELTYFKFSSFNLSIPPNFCGFKKLLELHLVCVEFESSALESLMSGCPYLEKLSIEHCIGCDYLVISSPSLKVLVLRWIDTKSICLKKAKIKRFSLSGLKKYEDIIPPMLRTSSFSSLEYLKLDRLNLKERGQLLHIVSILKSAPKLIELDIEIYDDVNTTQMTDHSKELECCSSCPKLQTVKIYGGSSQHAKSLIKFILANSPSLKTLTVDCIFIILDAPMLLKISQDLLRMERASPRAHVSFRH